MWTTFSTHTARTMLANSAFLVMLNQASTNRLELAKFLTISDTQLSYITNVDAGHGLIKVGPSLVPFANKFSKSTKLYKLMATQERVHNPLLALHNPQQYKTLKSFAVYNRKIIKRQNPEMLAWQQAGILLFGKEIQ